MSYELKNGYTTQDPRLDRLVEFDDRSLQYPIRTLLDTTRSPRSYTWRCNTWLDQGYEGACVGYAFTHDLAARPSEVPVTETMARNYYHDAQHIDPWPGCSRGHDGQESYEGTSTLSGAKTLHKAGWFKEYRWAFGINDVVLTLGYHGPVILGINWYSGMFQTDSNGYVAPTGSLAGGHAILARGYNVSRGAIRLHNSWGRDWGVDGDAWITAENLSKLLREDGDACVPSGRRLTPVPVI